MKQSTVWTIVIIIILVVLGVILIIIPKQEAPETIEPITETVVEKEPEDVLKQAKGVVPGGSLVTKEGELVSETGEIVSSEALPGTSGAPTQSRALEISEVPKDAVQLTITTDRGFEPDEFTVAADSVVTVSLTSEDMTHSFGFKHKDLQAISLGVRRGQIRAITFKAPAAGDYIFFCNLHENETGIMHVK